MTTPPDFRKAVYEALFLESGKKLSVKDVADLNASADIATKTAADLGLLS